MSGPTVGPRHDQVAELTRGVSLPLEPIRNEHLEILAEGFRQAFDDIRSHAMPTVANGDEPEVTALLCTRLNKLVSEDRLWQQLVLCVSRGAESISFDGSHLENRPDLSIALSDRDRRFPLIVEAKILDAATSKTIALYCKKGIRRFVKGEYAWGNREAFMLAYVRDGSSIDPELTRCLSRVSSLHPCRYLVKALPVPVGSGSSDLACTRHGRNFAYGSQPPRNRPGAISIWHLWLK